MIEPPSLDDCEYESLLEDARTRIPALAEAWSDLNPHDPGVTIVELLAWLTESYSYQLDQVTERHKRKYLQLLGTSPNPPEPASTTLSVSATEPTTLPAGTPLLATDAAGTKRFETDRRVALTDASLTAVQTAVADETGLARPFGAEPSVGDTFYLGFDGDPFAPSATLSLFLDHRDGEAGQFVPSVELRWAHSPADETRWYPLLVVEDATASLTQSWLLTLGRPVDGAPRAGSPPAAVDGRPELTWLRCRLSDGAYTAGPRLDGIETNVVPVTNRRQQSGVELERIEDGRAVPGLSGQCYRFPRSPVLSATVAVDGDPWTEVCDFDGSTADDTQYVLDHASGTVRFGGAGRGRAPPADATVTATSVTYGGGTAGNIPASASWHVDPAAGFDPERFEVESRGAARGGSDAEPVDAALGRARSRLTRPDRAVTADDYAALAARTPGVEVARTTVRQSGPEVTVVVVPETPADSGRPEPTAGFVDAVTRHLDERRLLTDRVTVTGPRWVTLSVSVRATGAEKAVRSAVRSYLDPLTGFEGEGWPFGRGVSEAGLARQVAAADGVEAVEDLSITAVGDATVDGQGRVDIPADALFALNRVRTAPGRAARE